MINREAECDLRLTDFTQMGCMCLAGQQLSFGTSNLASYWMRFLVNNSGFKLLHAKDVRSEFGQGVPHQLVTWLGLRQINMVEGIECSQINVFVKLNPKSQTGWWFQVFILYVHPYLEK